MKKQKKLYTGVHLLPYADNKMQFGMVDAWANLNEFIPVVRINLNKKKLSNFATEEDTISFEMSIEEAEVLARTLQTVSERVNYIILLAKRDKLKSNAFVQLTNTSSIYLERKYIEKLLRNLDL